VFDVFDRNEIAGSVRAWDKAGTEDDGAYTAGVLIHKLKDGRFLIDDVVRGQWGALERERIIKATSDADRLWLRKLGKGYKVIIEQEPGSGGKESAESTIRNLAGHHVVADKVTGSKEVRAEPFAAQCQGGNVWLKAGPWVENFLIEAEPWPQRRYLDQIDAAAMALAAGARPAISSPRSGAARKSSSRSRRGCGRGGPAPSSQPCSTKTPCSHRRAAAPSATAGRGGCSIAWWRSAACASSRDARRSGSMGFRPWDGAPDHDPASIASSRIFLPRHGGGNS
jgi:predicted phage terminase large subunit-like protein